MLLPHRFPFRWVELADNGIARVLVTANSSWLRGEAALPVSFIAELVAQSAALLFDSPEAENRQRWLAGIDRVELSQTVHAGDLLQIALAPGRRFGNAIQVIGIISRNGETIGEAQVLLV
ncbi:MAG: hypothetical protein ABI639_12065 [Thermoanaerobaculia bacterium]